MSTPPDGLQTWLDARCARPIPPDAAHVRARLTGPVTASERWPVDAPNLSERLRSWVQSQTIGAETGGLQVRLEALDGAGSPMSARVWGGSLTMSAPMVLDVPSPPAPAPGPVTGYSGDPLETAGRRAAEAGDVGTMVLLGVLRDERAAHASTRAELATAYRELGRVSLDTAVEARRMAAEVGSVGRVLGMRLADVHIADAETITESMAEVVRANERAAEVRVLAAERRDPSSAAPDREPTLSEELLPFVDRWMELQKIKAGAPDAQPKSAIEALALAKARGDARPFLGWLKGQPTETRAPWLALFGSLLSPDVQAEAAALMGGAS